MRNGEQAVSQLGFASFAPDLEQKTKVIMPILVYFCHYGTAWGRRGGRCKSQKQFAVPISQAQRIPKETSHNTRRLDG